MRTADLVSRYIVLTKEVMPHLARTSHKHWPVSNDHCFQRIVLDAVCGGVWYDYLPRPAYKNLTHNQAANAVKLCNDIIGFFILLSHNFLNLSAWSIFLVYRIGIGEIVLFLRKAFTNLFAIKFIFLFFISKAFYFYIINAMINQWKKNIV